jgi:LysM repeat protein
VKSEPTPKAEAKQETKSEPRVESKLESKPEPISKPNAATKIIVHKVHEGENLQTIARDFKVSLDELKRINNIEATKLSVGQEIFICLNSQSVVINPVVSSVKSPVTVDAGPKQIISPKPAIVKDEALKSQPVVKQEVPTKSEASAKPVYHKVKKGETLNAISRQYNVSVEDLKSANDLNGNKISLGQKLKITQTAESADKKEISQKVEQPSKAVSHKVRRKETLKSIAADFNLTVGELKELNNLKSNKVHSGQELIVSQSSSETAKKKTPKAETSKAETKHKTLHHKVKSGESYYSIAEKYNCTVKELKEWNNKTGNKLKPGVVLTIKSSQK